MNFSKLAKSYIDGIESGEINACKTIKQAIGRHVADLEKTKSLEFPFVFSEKYGKAALMAVRLNHHTSGSVAGLPFQLEAWQCFIIWSIYGWRIRGNLKARRFRKVYIKVPRKNGKTEFLAALANVEMTVFPKKGGELFWAATKRDQAKIGWNRQAAMMEDLVKKIPSLKKRFKITKTGSKILNLKQRMSSTPLGKDSKREDGHLVQMGLIDEYHAHDDNSMVSILETGMGAFEDPLLLIITTAGYNMASACKHLEDNYKQLLNGEKHNDNVFAMIYELDEGDDWEDERNWYKVNPSLGGALKVQYMKAQYAGVLLEGAAAMLAFKVKNLNIWMNSEISWISIEQLKLSNDAVNIRAEDLKGMECYGGLDLGSTRDLNAFTLYFPLPNQEAAILQWFWIPEETVYERTRRDGVKYMDWVAEGFIKTTPGSATDHRLMSYDILEIAKEYNIKHINFDSWGAEVFKDLMVESGWENNIHPFNQTTSSYTGPIKYFERMIFNKRLKHFNHPVWVWNVLNVVLIMDTNNNYKFDKKKSKEKIDGAVSAVMACAAYISINEDEKAYETRGLRIL